MKEKKRRMRKSLRSLLVRVEDVLRRISDDHIPHEHVGLEYVIESWEEEMDKWYTCLSEYLQQYSTSAVSSQIKGIASSVLWNLNDYLSSKIGSDQLSETDVRKIEALENNISFARNFIRFGTLFSANQENQEFQCFLSHIQPLVVGAAHLVLSLFSSIERRGSGSSNHLSSSNMSASLLNISHVDNSLLQKRYTLALTSLKHSSKLHYPTLGLGIDDLLMVIMEDFVASMLSTLWEMLQVTTHYSVSLNGIVQVLYHGLILLRTLVKQQPDKFDKIKDIAAAAMCDAGVVIFSLNQKDVVIDDGFQCFQDHVEVIRAEVREELVVKTPRFKYSETNVLGFLDFLLEDYLTDVKSLGDQRFVPKIREYLVFLKSCVGKLAELRNQQEILHQDLWNLCVEVAYKIELLIDQLVLGDILESFSMSLQSITEDIMTIKVDSLQIMNSEGRQDIFKVRQNTWPSADKVPSISSKPVADEVVGFGSEKASIVNRLMTGFKKLQVVAIVGMPGLGKTTLATKVYKGSSITHHFPVKAWCTISQVFDRRNVLLEFLNQIQPGKSDSTMNEDDLSLQLWRSLRKRRYLIFIDDIWDSNAFDLLKQSLPDDENHSRILLTSRHGDVVPEVLLDDKPLFLRPLTMDESLEILQSKLFPTQKDWPSALHKFGMEIAEYCKGLPLTIIIIAGLLKSTRQEAWKDVVKTFRSSIISDVSDQCESTIELSYKHLPDHLKPCFLWFGAFPEDHRFSVKRLIWLWIAEGFVRKSESKSLEEVATDYLKNLIGRSLVMNVKERTSGGVKTCHIHDLLHDFCLRKAKEDNFLHVLKVESSGEQEYIPSAEPDNWRKLSVHSEPHQLEAYKSFSSRLRSLLFFNPGGWHDLLFIFHIYKLLRVLDMEQLFLEILPSELGLLVQLRYLAIQAHDGYVCPEIGKLSNLETLVLNARGEVVHLPDTLWNLRKLRHLYSRPESVEVVIDNLDSSCNLLELETLSTLYAEDCSVMEKQLRKFPNIRQMKCRLGYHFEKDSRKAIDFSFLSQLESLSLFCFGGAEPFELIFPKNIKKLTLTGTKFPWSKIPMIAKLPYLEVLKLLRASFVGDTWIVEEGEFTKLKFLRLDRLKLVNWTATSVDLFPNLEKLVLDCCHDLEEVPECLGNAVDLEAIEVISCPDHVVSLLKSVEELQKEMGNSALQFYEVGAIYVSRDEPGSSSEQSFSDSGSEYSAFS